MSCAYSKITFMIQLYNNTVIHHNSFGYSWELNFMLWFPACIFKPDVGSLLAEPEETSLNLLL